MFGKIAETFRILNLWSAALTTVLVFAKPSLVFRSHFLKRRVSDKALRPYSDSANGPHRFGFLFGVLSIVYLRPLNPE